MKIIEKGDKGRVWPRQIRVPCCRSLIEIDAHEIQHGEEDGVWIDCPACGAQPALAVNTRFEAERWLNGDTP